MSSSLACVTFLKRLLLLYLEFYWDRKPAMISFTAFRCTLLFSSASFYGRQRKSGPEGNDRKCKSRVVAASCSANGCRLSCLWFIQQRRVFGPSSLFAPIFHNTHLCPVAQLLEVWLKS